MKVELSKKELEHITNLVIKHDGECVHMSDAKANKFIKLNQSIREKCILAKDGLTKCTECKRLHTEGLRYDGFCCVACANGY